MFRLLLPSQQKGKMALLTADFTHGAVERHLALSDWQSDMDHEKIRQKLGVSKVQWREVGMKLERLSQDASL